MSLYESLSRVLAPFASRLNGLLTGYDGTTYSSPAEAVRTQISDLHVLIGDIQGDAKISGSAVRYEGDLSATNVQAAIDETNEKFDNVNGRLGDVEEDLNSTIESFDSITNKRIGNVTHTVMNAYFNAGQITYGGNNAYTFYFPLRPNTKYSISVTGAFNRFAVAGCDSVDNGSAITILKSDGSGSFTEKTYEYVSDGTYEYICVMVAYNYASYNATISVVEDRNYNETDFYVNGVKTLTPKSVKGIMYDITDNQYILPADYTATNYVIDQGLLKDTLVGKTLLIPLIDWVEYKVVISGTFNRFAVAGSDSVLPNTPVTILRNDGQLPGFTGTKEYQYNADGTYNYLVVFYNYDAHSLSENVVIDVTAETVTQNGFSVNGVPVYTREDTDDVIKTAFVSDKYYRASDDVALASTSAEVWALYDALVTNYPNYVTKNTLTKGSVTTYEYVFGTPNYNDVSGKRAKDAIVKKPVILIDSGIHGYERSSVMSTYAFFKAMCENVYPACEVLQKCIIRLIPIVCPWGYDNETRWNENGVNINRNFDANWVQSGEPFDQNYSGPSAGSEYETQIVQEWLDAYLPTALLYIDHHNSGFTNEVSYLSALNTLAGASDLKDGYREGIDDAIGYWTKSRGMTDASLIYGYTGQLDLSGSAQKYGSLLNKLSVTYETSWNQNGEGKDSDATIGIGAEAVSVLMIASLNKLL